MFGKVCVLGQAGWGEGGELLLEITYCPPSKTEQINGETPVTTAEFNSHSQPCPASNRNAECAVCVFEHLYSSHVSLILATHSGPPGGVQGREKGATVPLLPGLGNGPSAAG